MATGITRSPAHDAGLLLKALGANRSRVEDLLRAAEDVVLIAGGGSDRQFYRIVQPTKALVLMVSPPGDHEFSKYLAIAQFLRTIGVGAPEIYEAYPEDKIVIMEDLGDLSLYRLLKDERSEEVTRAWYERVLHILARLQTEGKRHWSACPAVVERTFDYAALRWETDYFFTSFVTQYCRIKVPEVQELDQEFCNLATKVAAEPLFFMHRDFQSQNIMVHRKRIRIIDFQGARKGLLQYDLASLLKDSYIMLSEQQQQTLLSSYLRELRNQRVAVPPHEQFREIYTLAGLQRTMQALGAFAFLSRTKGKTWFEQFIPAGLHHLRTALARRDDFPFLRSLVSRISETLHS